MVSLKSIRRIKSGPETSSLDFSEVAPDFVDMSGFPEIKEELVAGVGNHFLFQRFSYFRWPFWLTGEAGNAPGAGPGVYPPVLLNNRCRDVIAFTTLASGDALLIDPSGMMSPSHDRWSLEVWALHNATVFRPQERIGRVTQQRDAATSAVNTVWRERDFEIRLCVYGARTSADEAIVEIDGKAARKGVDTVILVALRPYNAYALGGISAAEYDQGHGMVRVNGLHRVAMSGHPDFIMTGSGQKGDVGVFGGESDAKKVSCRHGMAAMALAYPMKKGTASIAARISLSGVRSPGALKLNLQRARDDFNQFAGTRARHGMNLQFSEGPFQRWFYGAKLSVLHALGGAIRDSLSGITLRHSRRAYYLALACHRMGYFAESERLLDTVMQRARCDGPADFDSLMSCAYAACALSDHFVQSRDTGFLEKRYPRIRQMSDFIHGAVSALKSPEGGLLKGRNSLEHCRIARHHLHDSLLLSFAMKQVSYLARCIGLFGDEVKYGKESARLAAAVKARLETIIATPEAGEAAAGGEAPVRDDFFGYTALAGYPFTLDVLSREQMGKLMTEIDGCYGGLPLYMKSLGGWDVFLSALHAVNLLLVKDARCYDTMSRLMDIGKETYRLPEIAHPGTGRGVTGEGDSGVSVSAFFLLLRNVLFMDSENRLELLPVPRQEWFMPGFEIDIRCAPSRFGPVSVRITSTSNEVQFHFSDLPKFVPPEIAINLPFRGRIKREDDFIIKKETGNTFVVNGWPSIVRITRAAGK